MVLAHFPAPWVPFDTEVALLSAGCSVTRPHPRVILLTPDDGSGSVHTIIVRDPLARPYTMPVFRSGSVRPPPAPEALPEVLSRSPSAVQSEASPSSPDDAVDVESIWRMLDDHAGPARRRGHANGRNGHAPSASPRNVVCELLETADALEADLVRLGLIRTDLAFYAADAAALAAVSEGSDLDLALDGLVGDDAWKTWAALERVLLTEVMSPRQPSSALLERSVAHKRRQQRGTPPVRRFLGRLGADPVAMIGYAPFGTCDLGIGAPGVLVRLRDVGVLPSYRRRGVGRALLSALAARAMSEVGATQVLICGATEGPAAALYRGVGARCINRCALFSGEPSRGAPASS